MAVLGVISNRVDWQNSDFPVRHHARVIAKGRGQRAEGMHIDGSWFQYLARVKSRLGDCYSFAAKQFLKELAGRNTAELVEES